MRYWQRVAAPFLWILLSQGAAIQALAVDLSPYESLYVRVMTSTEKEFTEEPKYLSGVLVSLFRGTNKFGHVGEAIDGAVAGALLEVNITKLRVVGGLGRFLGGRLSGKDKIAADVRMIDVASGAVLAETTVDGSGKGGFIWNVAGANIHAAMGQFAESLMSWSEQSAAGFGMPQDWRDKLDRNTPIAVRCSGIDENKKTGLAPFKQSDESLCDALKENLRKAQVSVVESSSMVLSLSVEAYGLPVSGLPRFESVLVGRWHIESSEGTLLSDVLASTYRSEKRGSVKRLRENAAEVVRLQTKKGVSALWPEDPQ